MSFAEATMVRAQWQPILFGEQPKRLELLKLKPDWPLTPVRIRVHRNHSFEHIASAVAPWFAWWGHEAQFLYSDYDDSLSFAFHDQEDASLELIWIDLQRYESRFDPAGLKDWLCQRLLALRARTEAPIIIAATGEPDGWQQALVKTVWNVSGVRIADLRPAVAALGVRCFDQRASKFSGTRLSDAACLLLAREIACRWAPASLLPRIKAVVVDLDHTLYDGVLGEDGSQVRMTPAHAKLQQFLLELREQGVFLGLVSRNEQTDVMQLFMQRKDFPLKWEHFSAVSVSWANKPEGLRHIAQQLRIGLDALLFVDDNPGELASVASELPIVRTACAGMDPIITQRVLQFYPTLWAWERSTTDSLRATDFSANTERAHIASCAGDPLEYLRSLQVRVKIEINPWHHLPRLFELSQKTNQFNLSLQRFPESVLARFLESRDSRVASITLTDRLSDSGVIGLIVAQHENGSLLVRELAISCRALGRQLESIMIAASIRALLADLSANHVDILHRTGPRNQPARVWLSSVIGRTLPEEGRVDIDRILDKAVASDCCITLEVSKHESKRN